MISNYSDDNAKRIWAFMRAKGLNDYAIAGLVGNIYAESRLKPINLQNSCNNRLGLTDEQYTAAVDNGTYTSFAGDSAGYGLCQWTSSGRKQGLYNYCKGVGRSIGDIDAQLEYLWLELNNGYKSVLKALQSARTVDEAARVVMLKFERPADQSEAKQLVRVGYGLDFYNIYAAKEEGDNMLDNILKVFESWVGYLEKASNKNLEDKTANAGKKNYTIFAQRYKEYTGENYQAQAWCAMFVSCCFVEAVGLAKAKELLCGKLYSYCPYGMNYFKNKGQLYTSPKKGDVVFFIRNGVARHTGIVYKVSGNTIYTIEGNTSGASGVIANGGGVCKKSYTVNSLMRFGRPNYTAEAYNATSWVRTLQAAIGVTVDGVAGAKTLAACPVLKKGSKGTVVELLQQRIGEHFKIPVSGGYDGSFGNGTLAAVKAFQKAQGLDDNGSVDRNTWRALLCIETPKEKPKTETKTQTVKAESAKSRDNALAGTYKVTASSLYMRAGAGTKKTALTTLPRGKEVKCYGYYTEVSGTKWLLVAVDGLTGYASSKYLKKV